MFKVVLVCVYYLWVQVCTDSSQVVQNYYTFFCSQLAECWTKSDTPPQQRESAERERRVSPHTDSMVSFTYVFVVKCEGLLAER